MNTQKPSPQKQNPDSVNKPPADISPPDDEKNGFKALNLPEPTRFGDWEVKGRCTDF